MIDWNAPELGPKPEMRPALAKRLIDDALSLRGCSARDGRAMDKFHDDLAVWNSRKAATELLAALNAFMNPKYYGSTIDQPPAVALYDLERVDHFPFDELFAEVDRLRAIVNAKRRQWARARGEAWAWADEVAG
jgi:hypothetical protein